MTQNERQGQGGEQENDEMFLLDIAYLRVYIGTHYAGDIIGGAAPPAAAAFAKRLACRVSAQFDRFVMATS